VTDLAEEDWMVYQRMFGNASTVESSDFQLGTRPIDNLLDTNAGRASWENADLMTTYIAEQRRQSSDKEQHRPELECAKNNGSDDESDDQENIDITTLSQEQAAILDRFLTTYQAILQGEKPPQ
jgi:hypothetical protein